MAEKRGNKTLARLLAAVLLWVQIFAFSSYALENWPTECYVLSEGACLMDADSGVVLYSRNAEEAYYPASITKVLTALVVLENCDNLSEVVVFSYDAVHIEEQNSTIIGASEDDRLSVLDCLYCLLFQSANEVANALAEHVGAKHPELKEKGENDRQVFVKLMNQKAAELGCSGSHFNNPSGLTDAEHFTTPHDMCLIMQAAIANEEFVDIESHTYWKHAPIRRYPDAEDPWNTVYMKHLMLRKNSNQYYEGCIAGKTGYTVTAGNTLVTACERDGMTLLCCVMNAHANHYNDTTRLFDFGFANFRSVSIGEYDRTDDLVQKDFLVNGVPVMDSMTLGIDHDTRVTLPKGAEISEVTQEFTVLEQPKGDTVAEVVYYYGSRRCGQAAMTQKPLGGMAEVMEAGEDPMFYKIAGIKDPNETTEAVAEEPGETESLREEETDTPEEITEAVSTEAPVEKEASAGKTITIVCISILVVVLLLGILLVLRYRKERIEEQRRHKKRMERMQKRADLSGSQQISLDLEVRRKMEQKSGRRRTSIKKKTEEKTGHGHD